MTLRNSLSLVAALSLAACYSPSTESEPTAEASADLAALSVAPDCPSRALAAGLRFLAARPATGNPDLYSASEVTIAELRKCPELSEVIEAGGANAATASAKAASFYEAGAFYAAPSVDDPENPQERVAVGFFRNGRKPSFRVLRGTR